MSISTGDKLPDATFLQVGEDGPKPVQLSDKLKGRKVVMFGLPGAFTNTCSAAHLPSFIRTHDALRAKGIDEVICFAVNDPFVMDKWGEVTGANAAGITMLADASAEFTKAIGMNFTAPPAGFYDRTVRHAMVVEDGIVTVFHQEEQRGVCEVTAGENILAEL